MTASKVLVLLENEIQVRHYLENYGTNKDELIISLSPFAIHELEKWNSNYKTPEYYCSRGNLYNLGIRNYSKVERLCSILDNYIYKLHPEIKKNAIKPAFFSFYYLKILYDAATLRLLQISEIIKKEKPDQILIYKSKNVPFGFTSNASFLFFDNRESLYSKLLELNGWKVKITFMKGIDNYNFEYPIKNKLKSITQSLGLFGFFKEVKNCSFKFGSSTDDGKHIALFGNGYNWESCGNDLGSILRISDNLSYWNKKECGYSDVVYDLKNNSVFRKFFLFRNVDFFPFVEDRIKFLLNVIVPSCSCAYDEVQKLMRDKHIKAFLSSGLTTPTSKSAAKAARDLGVPVFVWQHGSYGYIEYPMAVYQDIRDSDFHFVFGKGVIDKYKNDYKKFGTRGIPIGSTSLDSTTQKAINLSSFGLDPNKKTILYASTNFYLNHLYVSFYPAFSDNLFFKLQKSIIDVLVEQPDYNIIVKLHPNPGYRRTPIYNFIMEKELKNFKFIQDEYKLRDLIPLSEIIIIDFPSTTLLEALTSSKPIFTTTFCNNIDKKAVSILKKRVYCYSEIKDLTKALYLFLKSNQQPYQVDLNNREFLKLYGTHLDDGRSAERATKFLRDIIEYNNMNSEQI